MKRETKLLEIVGVKPTFERLSILKYLINNKEHPTAQKIYNNLKNKIPTISKTTIYNTLRLFIEKKIVTPIYITGNEERFDINTQPHHHFFCEKCGKIFDIKVDCPHFKKGTIAGHKIKELHGYFRGICKECLQK